MSARFLQPLLRYAMTGGLNTAVHWCIFAVLVWLGIRQSLANLSAFVVAVTISFFVNARWTFKARPSFRQYLSMALTMGLLSFVLGVLADSLSLHPLFTMIGFSLLSLVVGFLIAKFIVFREVS